jgi:hypothetical protein
MKTKTEADAERQLVTRLDSGDRDANITLPRRIRLDGQVHRPGAWRRPRNRLKGAQQDHAGRHEAGMTEHRPEAEPDVPFGDLLLLAAPITAIACIFAVLAFAMWSVR